MSQRQRIILVTDPFYPDESATAHILSKVAGFLAEEFELLVLAGPESYEDRPHRNTAEPPVDDRAVLRTEAAGLRKNNLPEKIARFLLLTISLSWQTLRHSRRTDIVFTVTNPAPMLVALAVIRKFRPFRLVVLVHDVFPENAAAAGLIGGKNPFYRLIRAVFNRAYGSADALITIGRDMSEVIRRKVPAGADRITLIENWADCTLVERALLKLSGNFMNAFSPKVPRKNAELCMQMSIRAFMPFTERRAPPPLEPISKIGR